MTDPSTITMAKATIHNPDEPRHFMKLHPVERLITIRRNGEVIARSTRALRLKEIGLDLYEPALYLPREDIIAPMADSDTSTRCPLKGDASYLSLTNADGTVIVPDIAWYYPAPIDVAAQITGLVSFYTNHVSIEESPLDAS